MSHFTVMVVGENAEEQLEPFSENIEVDPYLNGPVDLDWPRKYHKQRQEEKDPDLPQIDLDDDDAVVKWYYGDEVGDRIRFEDGKWVEYTTYNPKSKWDWYSLGGRWTGFFLLKPGATGELGHAGLGTTPAKPSHADSARKGAIDFTTMSARKAAEAADLWDRSVQPVLDAHGELVPFPEDEYRKMFEEQGPQDARAIVDAYWALPINKALRETGAIGWGTQPFETYSCGRDEYVARQAADAFRTYALLIDGQWIEPGQMGWFGMSTDDEADRQAYSRKFHKVIMALDDGCLLSVYDCHI